LNVFGNPRSRESKQNKNPTQVCESFQREERDKGVVTREEIDRDAELLSVLPPLNY
jgi:hypothetical protein